MKKVNGGIWFGMVAGAALRLITALVLLSTHRAGAAPPESPWGKPISVTRFNASGPLAFSLDGRTLAAVSPPPEANICLWEVCSHQMRAEIAGSRDDDLSLVSPRFTPDGRFLVSVVTQRGAGAIRVLDLARNRGRVKTVFQSPVDGFDVSPDGRHAAVAGPEELSVWNLERLTRLRVIEIEKERVTSIAYTVDGCFLVVAAGKNNVRLIRPSGGPVVASLRKHPGRVCAVAASPSGKLLASADKINRGVGSVRLWNADKHQLISEITGHRAVLHLSITASGWLITADDLTVLPGQYFAEVRFWDISAKTERKSMRITARGLSGMAHTSTGDLLAVADTQSRTTLYRLNDPPADPTPLRAGEPAPSGVGWKGAESLWDNLADADAKKAYRAIWSLAGHRREAVGFLASRLRQARAHDPARIARWLARLDADTQAERDGGEKHLALLGERAAPALQRAIASDSSAEVRRRAQGLLKRLEGPLRDPDRLREVRAVECLELIGTKEARELLAWLAGGAPEARLTGEARRSFHRLTKRQVYEVKEATRK